MARPSPDLLFARFIHGYLGTVASQTAGVPSTVPLVLMDDGKVARIPCLLVAGMEDKDSKTASKRVVNITTMLFYRLKNQDADAPTDEASLLQVTTRQQASEWMDAIESRLCNQTALAAYLATLSEADRSGWSILAYRPESTESVKRDKDDPGQTLACNVRICLAWSAAT
jgi:hypothetical protein